MDGTISVESTPGKGSVFRVELPLQEMRETDRVPHSVQPDSCTKIQPAAEADAVPLTAQMLAVLPQELRSELREALESLEEERINTIIEQVKAYNAGLQKTLAHLVENYDYPAILKALRMN